MQHIFKDVDNVLTCDATVCKNATPQPNLNFDEAAELETLSAHVCSRWDLQSLIVLCWLGLCSYLSCWSYFLAD
jgi:hypothetical protein